MKSIENLMQPPHMKWFWNSNIWHFELHNGVQAWCSGRLVYDMDSNFHHSPHHHWQINSISFKMQSCHSAEFSLSKLGVFYARDKLKRRASLKPWTAAHRNSQQYFFEFQSWKYCFFSSKIIFEIYFNEDAILSTRLNFAFQYFNIEANDKNCFDKKIINKL